LDTTTKKARKKLLKGYFIAKTKDPFHQVQNLEKTVYNLRRSPFKKTVKVQSFG